MVERKVVIQNETGFHARPASLFVKEASNSGAEVTIVCGDKEVSAKSIIGLLGLGASKGTELIVRVDGENEEDVIETLVEMIRTMD